MAYSKVSIIILNWNGLEDTIECLESLGKTTYENYNVVLIDNGSSGNDVKILKQRFGEYMVLIENDKNYGFSGGVNIGIKYALNNSMPDYIVLLNNDTIVDPEFLIKMVEVLEGDSSIGIAGPKIYYYGNAGHIQTLGEKLNFRKMQASSIGSGEEDTGQYDETREVDYNSACMLIKTDTIREIGLFDESYFCYWEDADYCFRARKAGYKVISVPESKIWHKKYMQKHPFDKPPIGKGVSNSALYYHTRNSFKFMRKYATKRQYLLYILFFLVCYAGRVMAGSLLFHRSPKRFISFCNGIKDGLIGKSGSRD